MHNLLVILIQAMDSFRTHERMNTYHLVALYDSVHNIIELYNELLKDSPEKARDIHLSQDQPVFFDDFINNYWPHLDWMILSKPDYEHAKHIERKQKIELAIQQRIGDGEEPIKALESTSELLSVDESSFNILKRGLILQKHFELKSIPLNSNPYQLLNKEIASGTKFGLMPLIDSEFISNMYRQKKSSTTHISD